MGLKGLRGCFLSDEGILDSKSSQQQIQAEGIVNPVIGEEAEGHQSVPNMVPSLHCWGTCQVDQLSSMMLVVLPEMVVGTGAGWFVCSHICPGLFSCYAVCLLGVEG